MQRREFLRTAGVGAGAVGAAGVAPATAAQEGEEDDQGGEGGQEGDAEGEDGGAGGGGTETVAVGPDNEFVFEPETLPVTPGTTVRWEWESDTHNVSPTSVPDDAEWEGHTPIEDEGFTYEYTFDVTGTYDYVCDPHSPGMAGTIEVDPNAGQGGGDHGPTVPASAMSLAIGLVAAMSSTVALAFFFLKYGRTPDDEE